MRIQFEETRRRWAAWLKPHFSEFVVHEGHAFGFDGSILACIGVEDGERKWKGRRYGHGQLVLLRDQDVLLVRNGQEMAAFRLPPASGVVFLLPLSLPR